MHSVHVIKLLGAMLGAAILVSPLVPAAQAAPVRDLESTCLGLTEDRFDDLGGFDDVAQSTINCLASYGITRGTSTDTYTPGRDVQRWEMALFLDRLLRYIDATSPALSIPRDEQDAGFEDLSGVPEQARGAVNQLANLGVAQGYNPREYRPFAPVLRRQMTTFLDRIQDVIAAQVGTGAAYDPTQSDETFRDVPPGHPQAEDIYSLQGAGIVQGVGNGLFAPDSPVTRAQMAFFLLRHLDENIDAGRAEPAAGLQATVIAAPCPFMFSSGDAVAAGDDSDVSRGFTAFAFGACPSELFDRVLYFSGAGTAWSHETTPYSGQVLAAADDGTGTYVLFSNHDGVFLGKRATSGGYDDAVQLSPHGGLGNVQGDLIAHDGQYWAVWTEEADPNFPSETDLFQAKTLGCGSLPREQITTHERWDSTPSLTLVTAAEGGSEARLAWSRHDGIDFTSGWIMYAEGDCAGDWSPPQTLRDVGHNTAPAMSRANDTDHLLWTGGPLLYAEVAPGGYREMVLLDGEAVFEPRIAVSDSSIGALFSTHNGLQVMLGRDGQWQSRTLSGSGLAAAVTPRMTPYGGNFTTFAYSDGLIAFTLVPW